MHKQSGYITIGVLFLVAGLAMLLAEYSTDTTLDVPDVYAGSELSDTVSISSTCSPTGNQFSAPTNVAFEVGFNSTAGALGGTATSLSLVTVGGGINYNGGTAETEMAVNSAGVTVAQDGTDFGSYHTLLANGFRMNRNVQCLGMTSSYGEVQMNIGNAAWVINLSADNASNAVDVASHTALTSALAYVIGGSGTANAGIIDNSVAELVIGGASNISGSAFGWSILLQRDIGISQASVGSGVTLQVQSELGQAQ